jgi:hypothetical protein
LEMDSSIDSNVNTCFKDKNTVKTWNTIKYLNFYRMIHVTILELVPGGC